MPRSHRALTALLSTLALCACGEDPTGKTDKSIKLEAKEAGATAVIDIEANTLAVLGADAKTPALQLLPLGDASDDPAKPPHVGIAARKASATVEMKFGSYKFDETATAPWQGATKVVALDGDVAQLALKDGNLAVKPVKLQGAGVGLDIGPAAGNRVSISWKCHPGEHFIGLGGQSFDVDHRGQSVPLWVSEDGLSKHPDNKLHPDWQLKGRRHSTHTPIPIAISSRGYAFAIETTAFTHVHLCSEKDDVVRVEVWEPTLKLRVFVGANPAELIDKVTAWTGRPKLPAPFAFGLWLDALYGSENVRRVAKKLRDAKSMTVAIWSEDWRGGDKDGTSYTLHEDWNVDRDLYPDFEKVDADLEALGMKWLTYNNTFITESADIYKEATSKGYSIKDEKGGPFLFTMHKLEPASLLDFTNPDAVKWARGVYQAGLDIGSDGWMADFCEWLPPAAKLHDGSDAMLHHNEYPVRYHQLNRALFDAQKAKDGKDRAWFTRSAWLGSQPLVDVVWAGDQQTDWSEGDGMRSVIPMGLGLGVVGFPYFGHDIGGYADLFAAGATTKELFFRWVTFGALSPVMRTHHGRNAAANWHWEKDKESTEHIARWGRLHGRLFPLLWKAAHDAAATGLPMMRPMAIDHPDFEPGWTATDQYILAGLYVAPVVEEAALKRTLALPKGTYLPLLGGAAVQSDGKAKTTVDAPLTEIPVFVPAGGVVVLLPDEIQTLSDVYGKGIVGLKEVGDDREVWVYRGGEAAFTEAGGKLRYAWDGSKLNATAKLDTSSMKATWNGKDIAEQQDGGWLLEGSGTLEVSGAKLVIEGGAAARKLRVRVR